MDLPLAEDLRRFLDGGTDPVEGALIVAGIVDATADADWARDEIGRLAHAIESLGEVTPRRVVEQFAGQGFRAGTPVAVGRELIGRSPRSSCVLLLRMSSLLLPAASPTPTSTSARRPSRPVRRELLSRAARPRSQPVRRVLGTVRTAQGQIPSIESCLNAELA